MKKVLFIILIAIFSFIGVNTGLKAANSVKAPQEVITVQVNAPEAVSEDQQGIKASIPQSLQIPKINVDTEVESAGLDAQKKPVLPEDPDNVVWYNLGPKPGEVGSSVVSGHFDKVTGAPAVFWDLKKLKGGDEIFVKDADGNKHTFTVTSIVDYPFDKVPLNELYAASTDKPLLNLITCGGTWNDATKLYSSRTVVYAELAE